MTRSKFCQEAEYPRSGARSRALQYSSPSMLICLMDPKSSFIPLPPFRFYVNVAAGYLRLQRNAAALPFNYTGSCPLNHVQWLEAGTGMNLCAIQCAESKIARTPSAEHETRCSLIPYTIKEAKPMHLFGSNVSLSLAPFANLPSTAAIHDFDAGYPTLERWEECRFSSRQGL